MGDHDDHDTDGDEEKNVIYVWSDDYFQENHFVNFIFAQDGPLIATIETTSSTMARILFSCCSFADQDPSLSQKSIFPGELKKKKNIDGKIFVWFCIGSGDRQASLILNLSWFNSISLICNIYLF